MLYELIKKESEGQDWRFLLAALLSAAANTAVLAVIDIGRRESGHLHFGLLVLFALTCVGYVFSYRYCGMTITTRIESALYKMRLRLGEKICQADLITLEEMGVGRIYDQIIEETSAISNSAWIISMALQALVFITILLLYIFYLSPTLFLLFSILSLLTAPLYLSRSQKMTELSREASKQGDTLFALLDDFLRGIKETRLSTRRGDDLHAHFAQTAVKQRENATAFHVIEQETLHFLTFALYALLAVTIFILPQVSSLSASAHAQLTAAALFLIGPIGLLTFTIPEYERAGSAAASLQSLETRLDQAIKAPPQRALNPFAGGFKIIEATELGFSYSDSSGGPSFALRPLSLSLRAGEIVFFVGGNGSGKTTLLKLLCGLYTPSSGSLRVDGVLVEPSNLQAYRELFSAVFTDFHLFKRLYGIPTASAARIQDLLTQMQIANKTSYGPAGFSSLELSTGQRKRVAMVVALLEDRPIYIFDEWAADQDPEFRSYYYLELLPQLKRQGKTILAISHDDRYFHCADRVVFMEFGSIRSIDSHPVEP